MKRQLALPFTRTAIEAGKAASLDAQPQRAGSGLRLVIPYHVAPHYIVERLTVGAIPIVERPIPADFFSEAALGFTSFNVKRGERIKLEVRRYPEEKKTYRQKLLERLARRAPKRIRHWLLRRAGLTPPAPPFAAVLLGNFEV